MRIAVIGLGYVGCVTGACLARMGHQVCGVDISSTKVRMINDGVSPIFEKDLPGLISRAVREGGLRASLRAEEAVRGADLSMVCVGTPSRRDGRADLRHVLHALGEIGRALRGCKQAHTVVLRSTVPPGTTENVVIPALEKSSGRKAGRELNVCFQPEFLREGSSVEDFFHPPRTVIGAQGPRGARRLVRLWRPIKAPLFVTSVRVAEMVKYLDNTFHALKITFANEVGALCKTQGVDSHEVMRIFVEDRKLNISPAYLGPGFAFGGPCLPKDLRALRAVGRAARVATPLLEGILAGNRAHLQRATQMILATGKKRIGVLGLAFKSGTDDLRESPACALVKSLLRAGRTVKVYDPAVRLEALVGTNLAFVEKELPQLPELLCPSLSDLLASSAVVVVTGWHGEFAAGLRRLKPTQILIDLVRLPSPMLPLRTSVRGICW